MSDSPLQSTPPPPAQHQPPAGYHPVPPPTAYPHQQPFGAVQPQTNGLATTALILGIVGFVVTMIPLFIGVFLGGTINITAFVFGIVGVVRSGQLPGHLGRGMAVTGIVLSSVAFLLMFVGAGWLW